MIHYVKNISINENIPGDLEEIVFGAGCFWGVEKKFWSLSGVFVTSVGIGLVIFRAKLSENVQSPSIIPSSKTSTAPKIIPAGK